MRASQFIARLVFTAIALSSAGVSHGQAYPGKPVRIVTAAPGGGVDFTARLVALGLTANLGQQFVVDNRGGTHGSAITVANAVMAGCKPDYMPVIIACVKGVADPKFNFDAVKTPTHNTSPLPIVNGPACKAIDLNCGYNHTGSRWQATSTIGRALQLCMINIGGTPGSINIHTQGHLARFEHCIAENEDEDENPWQPLHVERGYAADTSAVTVIPACPAAMIDDNGGYSKAEVKRFIWKFARIPFGSIPRGNLTSFSKKLLKQYADFEPAFGVPIADKPDDTMIVVMGGTGTHSLSVQTRLASENVTVPILRKDGASWRVIS